jgi:hypothetical protein
LQAAGTRAVIMKSVSMMMQLHWRTILRSELI